MARYGVYPLVCPKCHGPMHIIAFIENEQVIRKILSHLNLWNVKRKPAPIAHGPPADPFSSYDDQTAPGADDYVINPDYPVEAYF